ncbi:MAG: hypothetical protein ACX94C_12830 [Phycisphaerales bacterium]
MSERNTTCPHCGYDLTGLGRPEICPECGKDPAPLPKSVHFDRPALTAYLFTNVTLPTLIFACVVSVISGAIGPFGFIIASILLVISFPVLLGLWLHSSSVAVMRSEPFPRPVPLLLIPIFALASMIPSFIIGWLLFSFLLDGGY